MDNFLLKMGSIGTTLFSCLLLLIACSSDSPSNKALESSALNHQDFAGRLLIATEETKYKNFIIKGVTKHFENQHIYVKKIKVSDLSAIKPAEWDAICLLFSWENEKPIKPIQQFFDNYPNKERVVSLITFKDSPEKKVDMDAISGASISIEIPVKTRELIFQLQRLLKVEKIN